MLNLNKHTKTIPKPKATLTFEASRTANMCVHIIMHDCCPDNFPSYRKDNHDRSDDVYWRGRGNNTPAKMRQSFCQ